MIRKGFKVVGLTLTILCDLGQTEGQGVTGESSTAAVVSSVVVVVVVLIVGAIAGVIFWRR